MKQEEENNNMATTINHPYQTNILSATGSAEVLGRGSNTYTDTWSHSSVLTHLGDQNTSAGKAWDNFSNFPTAVRTGNFVWVRAKATSITAGSITQILLNS